MVLYTCKKCNKEFDNKHNFVYHINRKFPCIYDEVNDIKNNQKTDNNTNKIVDLEHKIKELEETNLILHTQKTDNNNNKIIELEQTNKKLEEKNLILHTQNIDKDKLLNKKDLEIKNLYKNIYSKNTDIQIKKIQEYVYIIRECDFVRLNEDIYKIGRTSKANPEDRFQKYRKGTEIVGFFGVKDSIECENKLIKHFSNHEKIKRMPEYGKEYFQGNKFELLYEILQFVKQYI
jgi:hypothetical protein